MLVLMLGPAVLYAAGAPHEPTAPSAPATSARAEPVVLARVGGDVVTADEFMNWVAQDANRVRTAALPSGRAELLKTAIKSKLLLLAMQEEGLLDASRTPTDAEASAALAKLEKAHFPAPSPPDDEQIAQFYEAHKESFGIPATVRISQIQIVVPDSADPKDEAAARERAQEALRRIDAGESFAEVAEDMTQNENTLNAGGDLGYLPLQANVWLDQAVHGLDVGENTGVVESPAGYEVLMVTDRKGPISTPLPEVRDAVASAWVAERQAAARARYFKQLAARYGVTIEDEQLQAEYPNGLF